jgi:heme-degrading monooxygenase HmoA
MRSGRALPGYSVRMARYHLAQLNIGRALAPVDSPVLAEFMAALAPINALADQAPGFVWRFQTEEGNATALRPYDDDRVMVNFSVWESPEALRDFVYRTVHAKVMARRREWFEKMTDPFMVLWWVPSGHRPTITEAIERLELLRTRGETEEAFTFKRLFPPPGEAKEAAASFWPDECPAT